MKKMTLLAGAGLAAVFAASGCATITRGTHERIEVATNPPGALCRLYRLNQGYLKSIVTPGAVYIQRSDEPVEIICGKKGFDSAAVIATPGTNRVLVGNAAAIAYNPAAIGGLAVDVVNGANQELPEKIYIDLTEEY